MELGTVLWLFIRNNLVNLLVRFLQRTKSCNGIGQAEESESNVVFSIYTEVLSSYNDEIIETIILCLMN